MKIRNAMVAALLVPLVGCAGKETPPPRAELAQAELAIEQAQGAEAAQYAPLQLREARERLTAARDAAYQEEYTRSRRLAQQAQVSAELALAQAQTERTEMLAREALEGVETLRAELDRKEADL